MRGLLIVFLSALSIGCGSLEDLDNFDVEVRDETTVEAGTAIEGLLAGFPQLDGFTRLDISQSAEFEERGYNPDDVDSIRLTRLTLSIIEPAEQDLAFLGSVQVIVSNPDLPDVVMAERLSFDEGEQQVDFETSDANLRHYLLGTRSTITFDIEDSRRPMQDTRIEVEAVFDVDVNVI
jgi:hypothetical protein